MTIMSQVQKKKINGPRLVLTQMFFFLVYKNEKEGRIPVEIKSAVELDENSKKKLIETINTFSGMECSATYELSKELIGGFTVKVKDEIIDASIKRQLENLKTELAKSEI